MKGILAILIAGLMVAAMIAPAMGDTATTSASVGNAAPAIDSIAVTPDDDTGTTGVQVNPVASSTKTVTVTAVLSDANGYGDISTVTASISPTPASGATITMVEAGGSGTTVTYVGTYEMEFYDNPADYTVTVTVSDGTDSDNTPTAAFTYTGVTSITVTDVAFGALATGQSSSGIFSTVTNKGNTDITFADPDTTGYDTETGDGLQWSEMSCTSPVDEIADDQITTAWSAATSILNGASSSSDVPFTLTIPASTLAGSYAGTITFTPTGTV